MLTDEQIRVALRPLCDNLTTVNMLIETSMDEYRAIEAAVRAELAEDAQRYRWLRAQDDDDFCFAVVKNPHFDVYGSPEELDAAIDAARAAKGGE